MLKYRKETRKNKKQIIIRRKEKKIKRDKRKNRLNKAIK
jgi:hypothetical protein